MTVATQLAKQSHTLEYVLAIEGIGWPDSLDDLDGDWDGTVFATADIAGDMASTLGCTVVKSLRAPGGFSESFDPEAYTLTAGGMTFSIVNADDVLSGFFRAHLRTNYTGDEQAATLESGNVFNLTQTTMRLQYSNPGGTVDPAEAGAVVWVGGSEAVLLGARTSLGSDAYSYASCTRGYLGTPQGNIDRAAFDTAYGFVFDAGTSVYPWNPYWRGRRTILCARHPGTDQLSILAHGLITQITRERKGSLWSIATAARTAPSRMRRKPYLITGFTAQQGPLRTTAGGGIESEGFRQLGINASSHVVINITGSVFGSVPTSHLFSMFAYRTVPGGTRGMLASSPTDPQAEEETYDDQVYDNDTTRHMSNRPVMIGSNITRLLFKANNSGTSVISYRYMVAKRDNQDLGPPWVDVEEPEPLRLLVDNCLANPLYNPFAVSGRPTKNAIDFALTLLTSFDGEFYRADAAAAGTTTTVNFTAPSWSTDQWAGYALHCVEGDNKGEARLITGNDSDTLTVAPAFASSTHSGNEYQIRNSIYDTLPYGFGMQVHNAEIDIAEWERVRDSYGPLWQVGNVVLGLDDEEDYWDLLQTQVFRIFGAMPFIDRASGKLSLRYVGETYPDELIATYTSIDNDDILPGSLAEIDLMPRPETTTLRVKYKGQRIVAAVPVLGRVNSLAASGGAEYGITHWKAVAFADDVSGEAESTLTVNMSELKRVLSFNANGRELTFEALLCGHDQASVLREIMLNRLFAIAVPPPEGDVYLSLRKMLELYAGGLVLLNADNAGLEDPYTGSAALTNHLCRILNLEVSLRPPRIRMRAQLLGNSNVNTAGLIAPACIVTNKGTVPDDHFEVEVDNFCDGADDGTLDWDELLPGDLIELRDTTGALKEGPKVIASFGSNEASTPGAAASFIINVTSAIAASIAAGDYVTLAPWSASNTTNMNRFCAYADATDEELGTGDSPKKWG